MDNLKQTTNGQESDIEEVISVQPIDEAEVSAVAEAVTEQVVVAKPKRGLGLAAFFSRLKRDEPDETVQAAENVETAPAMEAVEAAVEESMQAAIEEPLVEDVAEVVVEESVSEAIIAQVDEGDSFEETPPHKNGQLKEVLECMLFVADGPLTAKELATHLVIHETTVVEALSELAENMEKRGGIKLMRIAGGYQLGTKPEYADYCTMLLQPAKKRLSKAALETLAVVAYRQPCTMPEVEAVRGVAVDGVMRTLTERGLVKEAGRKQTPGRPILYATTAEFLEYFGLNDLSELPDIDLMAVEEVKALEAQRELFAGEQAEEAEVE